MPRNYGPVFSININTDGIAGFKPEAQKFLDHFVMAGNIPIG